MNDYGMTISSFFIVEEASADLLKEQMTLKLKVV